MKFLASLFSRFRRPRPSTGRYAKPAVEVSQELPGACGADPAPGPGHPDWAGRAAIPLVERGWALPGHPLHVYQQFLKYQNDANGLPDGWRVIGWTPEGVSYVVPEVHWTAAERLSAHPTVRSQHNPHMTPDEVCRERLKATTTGLMSDAEIDARVAQYRAYTTKLNEDLAAILDAVRAGAERHAVTRLEGNAELEEAIELAGDERFVPEKLKADRVAAWVKECGQRAVDKRLADARKLIAGNGLLAAIPVDNHIYAPPG